MAVDPFYKSAEWRDFRRKYLEMRPVCAVPGCGKASRHVDHIVPRRRGGAPLDPANCQPLCWSCHSRKTTMADGGFGNPTRENVSGIVGCDSQGNPIDPKHHWNRRT